MKNLKEKIQKSIRQALKEHRSEEVSTLRLLDASIINKEKEKRAAIAKSEKDLEEKELIEKSQLTDEEIVEIVSSEIKKRKEAILEFERGKRMDLAEKEKREAEVLKRYLPKQLSEKEIKELAKEVIQQVGAHSPKDTGKVMANLMPKLKGKAEGALVSRVVKELLAPK